jgi:UDP:flavonoid glycosyltransferase YjiC (YdhE family)
MPAAPVSSSRPRILFFAEAVTLAHVARPVALASALLPQGFDVHLAQHPRYRHLIGDLALTEHAIHSISPQQFMQALAAGTPLYDLPTLQAYVEEDLKIIAAVQPDIIVGDFRLSLAVSAKLAAVPHIALSNAYWSPFCQQSYTVPDLPMTQALGPRLAQSLFSLAHPVAFALHCLPMHRLRRSYGLQSLGFDLRTVYTFGDYTLYADIPELYRMQAVPRHHQFIGPIVWSPHFPLPPWWEELPQDTPLIYVTLGSSGKASLLPELIAALGQMNVIALVSTAGAPVPQEVPANVYVSAYLPGEEAVKLASLVICNGGSPTTHQALVQGVPVIGVATNLDQFLNMAAIERFGAGRLLRASTCNAAQLRAAATGMLVDGNCRAAARNLAQLMARCSAGKEFMNIIKQISGDVEKSRVGPQHA